MYTCKECKKKTDILAEGMCVSCYEKSPLYNIDSKASIFSRQEELEDELSALLDGNTDLELNDKKKKALLAKMAGAFKQLKFAHAMAAIGIVVVAAGGYLYYDYTKMQTYKATIINDNVAEIVGDSNTRTCAVGEKYCDRDGDKIPDQKELSKTNTDPLKSDTDGDGLNDYEEIVQYSTNPNRPDTDGDGINDGDEVIAGTNPLNPSDN